MQLTDEPLISALERQSSVPAEAIRCLGPSGDLQQYLNAQERVTAELARHLAALGPDADSIAARSAQLVTLVDDTHVEAARDAVAAFWSSQVEISAAAASIQKRFRDFFEQAEREAAMVHRLWSDIDSHTVDSRDLLGRLALVAETYQDGLTVSLLEVHQRVERWFDRWAFAEFHRHSEATISAVLSASEHALVHPGRALLAGSPEFNLLYQPLQRGASNSFKVAALTRKPPARPPRVVKRLEVTCAVFCQLCGERIYPAGERRFVSSEVEIIEVEVPPVCETCITRAGADPGYLDRLLPRLASAPSPYRLIRGDAADPSEPRGRGVLRLVSKAQEDRGQAPVETEDDPRHIP